MVFIACGAYILGLSICELDHLLLLKTHTCHTASTFCAMFVDTCRFQSFQVKFTSLYLPFRKATLASHFHHEAS
jgi:hypothetical protein